VVERRVPQTSTARSAVPEASIAAAESIGRAAHVEPLTTSAEATHALYQTYGRQVFGFCLKRLGSREEAEDAVQSTFLNAHRALQRGVTPEVEVAWLFKIAHNVCLTRRRSSWRRGRVEQVHDLAAMQDRLPAAAHEPAAELFQLNDALADLPETQRRAILLREWHGLSYAEIARELQVTQAAVETLIFRARRRLASNLERVVPRPRVLARVRHALDLGWLVPALKGLIGGGAAANAAAAAIAVSSVAVIATVPNEAAGDNAQQDAAPTARAPVAPRSLTPLPAERFLMPLPLDGRAARSGSPGFPAPIAVERSRGKATGRKAATERRARPVAPPPHAALGAPAKPKRDDPATAEAGGAPAPKKEKKTKPTDGKVANASGQATAAAAKPVKAERVHEPKPEEPAATQKPKPTKPAPPELPAVVPLDPAVAPPPLPPPPLAKDAEKDAAKDEAKAAKDAGK
jgi:RNA polymerase sigma-70 factor (ECF subfamily)